MKRFIITMVVMCAMYTLCSGKAAITYAISGGRLGDQLIHYCVARKLSLDYNLSFYFRRFKYSDKLALSDCGDLVYSESLFKHYKKVNIGHEFEQPPEIDKDILYIVTSKHWNVSREDYQWYGVSSDKSFINVMKNLIKPRYAINEKITLPENFVSVAVHIRKGEGYDPQYNPHTMSIHYYNKIPNDQFYVDGLKKLQSFFKGEQLYVYVFTDAHDREAVVHRIENKLNDPFVVFHKKGKGPVWDNNVLEDLFAMAQFDCLVRPHSAYSVIAQLIGNYKYIVYPGGELVP